MIMLDRIKTEQILEQLEPFQKVKHIKPPKSGWIRAIRELYGMPLTFLGKRLGLVQSRVSTAEKSETEERLTLHSLRKFAEALNCDLVYVLVPREDPMLFLEKCARKKAIEMAKQLQKTMKLENQAISEKELKRHIDHIKKSLLENPKKIWDLQ